MSIKNVLLLLVIIGVVVSTNAQLPQFPFPFPFQPIPGMPGLPDIAKCWSSVMNIPGCITEISQAILTGKFGSIGPACCKAFLEGEANCMPKIPFNPFFPPMLKEQCSKIAGAVPPATK
ncbi:hypothetical protein CARUB_v10011817mg [Capsella rubella]|uniref:Prolamin-like domain-containing protein n=1 Tax=Capsella rubella TaxID=81985 RepID=R0I2Z7_9BRAS|nr:uncharacterized protein LOC17900453 [Capsella rubella]EOA36609.1 hypothetical protein CARUB_v10011817mg [Capsella rubella]